MTKFSQSNLDIVLKGAKFTLRDLLKCQNAFTVVSISVFNDHLSHTAIQPNIVFATVDFDALVV